MESQIKLCCCKVCGEPSENILRAVVPLDVDPDEIHLKNGHEYYRVECGICGSNTGLYDTEEEAIERWDKINK